MGMLIFEIGLARYLGGLDIVEIESVPSPASLVAMFQAKGGQLEFARVCMDVDISELEYPVTRFEIRVINSPLRYAPRDHPQRPEIEKASMPLTVELRQCVVEELSNVLREHYVYPDRSEKIVQILGNNLKNGEYENFEDSSHFAERLTKDMQDISP